jgi:uncharacterized membrane protein
MADGEVHVIMLQCDICLLSVDAMNRYHLRVPLSFPARLFFTAFAMQVRLNAERLFASAKDRPRSVEIGVCFLLNSFFFF